MIITSLVFFHFFAYLYIISINAEKEQYPLILVDGKRAPRLSPLSFHINNVTDSGCMNCHSSNQKFSLDSKLIIPIATEDLEQVARRPLHSGLIADKLINMLNIIPPSINDCLDEIITR